MGQALRIKDRPVATLVPYARNARTHDDAQVAQIAASIEEFGWTNPVLIDGAGGIIAGHGRVLAALLLGIEKIPCIQLGHLSEAQRRAYAIADNKIALNAGWDEKLLAAEFVDLEAYGFDLDLTGFAADEILALVASEDPNGGETPADEAPGPPAVPVARPGDLWLLGRHRVFCGDATVPAHVARLLGRAKPHLMVTDPPYGVEYDPGWRQKAGLSSEDAAVGSVRNDDRTDWRQAWALFPGSVAYVWHGSLFAPVVLDSLRACGFEPRAQIVWIKTHPVISRGHYNWQHEVAAYVQKPDEEDGWRFSQEHELSAYAVKKGKTGAWNGGYKQSTVWFIEHLKSETGHGTQKPIDCMRRPIVNNSTPGSEVYDPFLGSGTTIIAAEMEGRRCLGLEIDPAYVDVIVQRWQDFLAEDATLEGDGRTFKGVAVERRGEIESPEPAARDAAPLPAP